MYSPFIIETWLKYVLQEFTWFSSLAPEFGTWSGTLLQTLQ